MYIVLAGGVGGAKLAQGLSMILSPERLSIIVNTGDDFEHNGLNISPDLDTVMYWLAKINDTVRGWGIAGETWSYMAHLKETGGAIWFQLGDKDLQTHRQRTELLGEGKSLSEVTDILKNQHAIKHKIIPMADVRAPTMIRTHDKVLSFQDYFVKHQCVPPVTYVDVAAAAKAECSRGFSAAMQSGALEGIIIAPSNPLLSVGPILAMPGVREWLGSRRIPAIAVSPIINGKAVKGPAAKIFTELGMEVSPVGIAKFYRGMIDYLAIDSEDAGLVEQIRDEGAVPIVLDTLMNSINDSVKLSRALLGALSGGHRNE